MSEIDVVFSDWHAVHDFMAKNLRVYGDCRVAGGGFALHLEPHIGGINPQMLMLALHVTPTGESPSDQHIEWEQPWSSDGIQYTEVGFVVGDGSFTPPVPPTLKVEDVH